MNTKPFNLTISWDRLRSGEFPKQELLDCDKELNIDIERVSVSQQRITLNTTIPDTEDINEISFEIGRLVSTITSNRDK